MNERETEHDGFCSCFSLESKNKGRTVQTTQTCRRLLDDCLFCFLALALSPVRRSALSVLFSSQRSRLSPSASLPSHSHAASLPLHSHAARRLERTGGGRHRFRSSFAGNDGQARSPSLCSAPHSHKAVSSSVQSLTARAADATFACACTKKQTQKQEAKEQPTLQGKKNRRIFVVAVVVAVPSSSSSSNPPPPPQPAPLRKMSFRRRLKHKRPPAGWDKIEETIEDFEAQMRDVVAEGHEGERRAALSWKVHRVHWEKNRFIFDLVYVRKVMSRELVSFEFVCVCGGGILI